MAPQGIATYDGINPDHVTSASMTFSHGITPSSCLFQMVPQLNLNPPPGGTLKIHYNGQAVVEFPDAIIDQGSIRRGSGGVIISLRILDRRWKWRYGEISGWYNRREPNGKLDPKLEKKPQELAELCFKAMGETNFDVGDLPNGSRPEVNWVCSNPANELGNLVNSLGCRVVLQLDNSVKIHKVGEGQDLPEPFNVTNDGFGVNPTEKADTLKLHGAPIKFQSRLKLEAVGKEKDGSVVPIEQLSYRPPNGWENETPYAFYNVTREDDRKLAVESVFKWYRIVEQCDGTKDVPGLEDDQGNPVQAEPWQMLPLAGHLLQTQPDKDGVEVNKPAIIRGAYWDGEADFKNTERFEVVDRQFSIQAEDGIVVFTDPTYALGAAKESLPAEMDIETAYLVLDANSRQHYRYSKERDTGDPKLGTEPKILRHDEIEHTKQAEYGSDCQVTAVVTNQQQVDDEADHWLDAEIDSIQTVETKDIEYADIRAIELDGAIQQVSWSVGQSGAKTRASRNDEFDRAVLKYARKQEIEEQKRQAQQNRGRGNRQLEVGGALGRTRNL